MLCYNCDTVPIGEMLPNNNIFLKKATRAGKKKAKNMSILRSETE